MDDIVWTIMILAVAGWAIWKWVWPKADVNNDGKVDVADAVQVVKKTTTRVKKVVENNAAKSKKTEK